MESENPEQDEFLVIPLLHIRLGIFLLILAMIPNVVRAQDPVIRFDRITTEDGLSHNHVTSILQDSLGFMWFGTKHGLNRYDGSRFVVYRHDPNDPASLSGNWVGRLLEDPSGDLWIGTPDDGLCRWHRARDDFACFTHRPEDPTSLPENHIEGLHQEPDGTLWIGTASSGLARWNPSQRDGVFEHIRHDPFTPESLGHDAVRTLAADREGNLWVGTEAGLERFDPESGTFIHYRHDPALPSSLSHNNVNAVFGDRGGLWVGNLRGLDRLDLTTGVFQNHLNDPSEVNWTWDMIEDRAGRLWVARDDGLYLRRSEGEPFVRYRHEAADPNSLSSGQVFSVYEDRSGVIWAGTHLGISKWNPSTWSFGRHPYKHGVVALSEDAEQRLWIGTNGGGLDRLDRTTGETVHYGHDPEEPTSLADDRVMALLHDRQGTLWVGTRAGGLNRFDAENKSFVRFQHDPARSGSLSNNWVGALVESGDGNVWVGSQGLCRFVVDRSTPATTRQPPGTFECHQLDTERRNFVFSLAEDSAGVLWASTNIGILRLDPSTGKMHHYVHDPGVPHSLSNDFSTALHVDRSGVLWIGTETGLDRLEDLNADPPGARFEHFGEAAGLPPGSVVGIQSDNRGFVWLAGSRGLTRFDPRTQSAKKFDPSHGLQGNDFFQGGYQSPAGELFFGGSLGFNAFFPDRILGNTTVPHIRLTSFSKLNQPFDLGRPLHLVKEIRLDHRDSIISFGFAALDFTAPEKNRYAYRLLGLTEDWIDVGNTTQASFIGLAPGNYVFQVKGSNSDGVWNDEEVMVKLSVAPPPWRSWWAYSLYALAIAVAAAGFVRQQQNKVERERAINHRLRELDRLKDEFLANTSHELRTPLYGIIGLAESMRDTEARLPDAFRDMLANIIVSGHRLQRLVGDILDFSQLKQNQLELVPESLDLEHVVTTVFTLLRPLADDKHLTLVHALPDALPAVHADKQRLEQILLNLVGNAVKFTDSGKVEISVRPLGQKVRIDVRDTGRGIAPEYQKRIFQAFEQADGSTLRQAGGTGLGLAVSRHLVELHGGQLSVESRLGEGATFSFTLPTAETDAGTTPMPPPSPASVEPKKSALISARSELPSSKHADGLDKGRILVVDDEPINRFVLRAQLEASGFEVDEAVDGIQALESLEDIDLVLLDVMMPRMSGFEACRRLRERFLPIELPVIFVTAKDRPEDLAEGRASGANDYLVKPVHRDELLAKIHHHLESVPCDRHMRE